MARQLRVAVVGGGLGGLTAGVALARIGVEAHVFEQASELKDLGAGIGLTANAIKVLRELGFEATLRERGFEPEARVGRDWATAEPVFHAALKGMNGYGAPHIDIHRADLLEMLAEAFPEDRIQLNSRCVDVSSSEHGAVLTLNDGRQVEADIVVGCDGIRSHVRAAIHGADEPRFTGNVCWRALIPRENVPSALAPPHITIWMGSGGHVVTYYVRSGRLLNVVAVKEASGWSDESWALPGSRDELCAAYAGTHRDLRTLLERVERCFKWGLFDRDPLALWGKQRVTLLGDAAHPMLPFLGQGAAMAIEDACVLARALALHPHEIPMALRAYETTRIPRTTQVQLASRSRQKHFHRGTPAAAGLRVDWVYEYDATSEPMCEPRWPKSKEDQQEC